MSTNRHIEPSTSGVTVLPEVSVIVPVYNAATFLNACVTSILASTFTDFELILVDDGSTDDSSTMCDSYASDSRVNIIHTPNRGVSAARNTGIDAAKGCRIVFVDSDDTISPTMLSRLVDLCDNADTRIAVVGVTMTERTAQHINTAFTLDGNTAAQRLLRQKDFLYNTIPGGKIFDRNLFECQRFRSGRYEDLDIVPRLFIAARKITFDPTPLYFYRQHPDAFCHKVSPARLDVLRVTADLEAWARKISPDLYKAARDRRFSAAFNIFNLLTRHDREGRYSNVVNDCYATILDRRGEVLCSRHARIKNRLGALATYLGRTILACLARHTSI